MYYHVQTLCWQLCDGWGGLHLILAALECTDWFTPGSYNSVVCCYAYTWFWQHCGVQVGLHPVLTTLWCTGRFTPGSDSSVVCWWAYTWLGQHFGVQVGLHLVLTALFWQLCRVLIGLHLVLTTLWCTGRFKPGSDRSGVFVGVPDSGNSVVYW